MFVSIEHEHTQIHNENGTAKKNSDGIEFEMFHRKPPTVDVGVAI